MDSALVASHERLMRRLLTAAEADMRRWKLQSASTAHARLRWCIRHDREACGDGKWVPYVEGCYLFGVPLIKARLRWEPRR